jgi:phage host-nuclease inhibitor protein Gam
MGHLSRATRTATLNKYEIAARVATLNKDVAALSARVQELCQEILDDVNDSLDESDERMVTSSHD